MTSAVLIFNKSSGSHLSAQDALSKTVGILRSAGIEVRELDGDLSQQLPASLEAPDDIVVVGGGDGTIRATIEAHRGRGRPIGIIPGGTMNLLALDFGIPEDPEEAAKVIAAGHTRPVDYGLIDGRLFLHTCFTGLPVRIGRHREDRRGKMSAADRIRLAFHAVTTLARDPKIRVTAVLDDGERTMESPSYAILVGTIGDQLLPRPRRESVTGGVMTVFAIHPHTSGDIARLILKGAFGFLASDEDVDKLMADRVTMKGPRRRLHAMLDGEHMLLRSPAEVEVVSGEIDVFAPMEAG